MEKLYELLEECCPGIDFRSQRSLIDDKLIDSMDLIAIISDIEDAFSVSIGMDQIEPKNFNSAEAIWELIESLK